MKKYVAVSQGIVIAEFKNIAEAQKFAEEENEDYYDYVQQCIDSKEEIADNEVYIYEEEVKEIVT